MRIFEIIEKKRDKFVLSKEEINFFIEGIMDKTVKDYHISALLMAIYLNGINEEETFYLTDAIIKSGDSVDLSKIEGIKVDKHSTGGVGDKITIALAPLVASYGVNVAKLSGRGLGHTGGTVDKLESLKGFKTTLSEKEFFSQVNDIKVSVLSQTKNLAPADKILYALRDVTATIDNIGLIASSIVSKKIAGGSDKILFDVKVGNGAFLENIEKAKELSIMMVKICKRFNKEARAIITNMDEPLGNAIGNSLEVKEAIDSLKGNGPSDFRELLIYLAANMLFMAEKVGCLNKAKKMVYENLNNNKAYNKFLEFVEAQGGTLEFKESKYIFEYIAEESGYINSFQTKEIGVIAGILGAGRINISDEIDYSAGILLNKKVNDEVKKGDVIATLYTDKEVDKEDVFTKLKNAINIGKQRVKAKKMILSKIYYKNDELIVKDR